MALPVSEPVICQGSHTGAPPCPHQEFPATAGPKPGGGGQGWRRGTVPPEAEPPPRWVSALYQCMQTVGVHGPSLESPNRSRPSQQPQGPTTHTHLPRCPRGSR